MDIRLLDPTEPWTWPEDAGAILLRALTDKESKPDQRLLATELAGDVAVINDEIAEALLAIAARTDGPKDLRCQAAIALGPSLEYQDTLDPELDDDDDNLLSEGVVRQIQETLQRLCTDDGVPFDVRRPRRRLLASGSARGGGRRFSIPSPARAGPGRRSTSR